MVLPSALDSGPEQTGGESSQCSSACGQDQQSNTSWQQVPWALSCTVGKTPKAPDLSRAVEGPDSYPC